jgi:DNA polymerase III delta subunit
VRAGAPVDALGLLGRVARGDFPSTVYLEGSDEAVKAAFLAEFRRAWAAEVPDAPQARVLRPDEQDVDAILAAYQNVSLFAPRELTVVFEVEDLGRSEKKVAALAAGLARPAGGACIVLVESAADSVRKTLEPLRAACSVRVVVEPPGEGELLLWGRRRLAAANCEAEPGALEALLETCERDALAFLNEVGKLAVLGGTAGRVTRAHVQALTAPRLGADMPDFLLAVASGDAPAAAQRLERLLAAGENEGSVLWALGNLVAGSFGGWSRWRDLAMLLGRRRRPHELARALDAVYRAESAWKGGRTDARSALEQATREVAAR